MAQRYVQATLASHEYEALRQVARAKGIPIKEAVHEAVLAWVRRLRNKDDPFFQIIGIAKGGGPRDSEDHDAILYGWEKR